MRVGRDAVVEVFELLLDARQQRADLARVVVGKAQHGAAPMGIAAAHLARCFLQHHDALGTVLPRRHGRGEGRIAGADDNHIVLIFLHFNFFCFYFGSVWPIDQTAYVSYASYF